MGLFDNPWHILIVLLVLVLLFGSAKLPKAAKSMGEAMRIFKKEAQKLHDEDDTPAAQVQAPAPPQVAAPPPPAVQAAAQQAGAQQAGSQEQMAALKQQMDALQQQLAAQQGTTPPTSQPG
jgi:sec-independent protein translocase protein TatA